MPSNAIAYARLLSQQIAQPRFQTPGDVVAWLGALQAQDHQSALWAVGLRLSSATGAATEASIEHALADRTIVRTWPMRRTLHLVAAADVRWMLDLLTPRVLAQAASRRAQLEIDEPALARTRDLLIDALQGGRQQTRDALLTMLNAGGVATANQRGYHLLVHWAQAGLICLGARQGKQQTFVLLDEWIPNAPRLHRDEALAALALRYFTSHGPASLSDFVWWSSLTTGDARAAIAMAAPHLVQESIDGVPYWAAHATPSLPALPAAARASFLLPSFDELLLGYRDRSAVLDPGNASRIQPGANGVFKPIVVVDGAVVGTWKRTIRTRDVAVAMDPFAPLPPVTQPSIEAAIERYRRFLGFASHSG